MHATGEAAQSVTNKAGVWIPTRNAILESDPFYKTDPFIEEGNPRLCRGD